MVIYKKHKKHAKGGCIHATQQGWAPRVDLSLSPARGTGRALSVSLPSVHAGLRVGCGRQKGARHCWPDSSRLNQAHMRGPLPAPLSRPGSRLLGGCLLALLGLAAPPQTFMAQAFEEYEETEDLGGSIVAGEDITEDDLRGMMADSFEDNMNEMNDVMEQVKDLG